VCAYTIHGDCRAAVHDTIGRSSYLTSALFVPFPFVYLLSKRTRMVICVAFMAGYPFRFLPSRVWALFSQHGSHTCLPLLPVHSANMKPSSILLLVPCNSPKPPVSFLFPWSVGLWVYVWVLRSRQSVDSTVLSHT
jgi:hypothetical protein